MRYCTNCGNLLGENDQACPACNTVVKSAGKIPIQADAWKKPPSAQVFSSEGYVDSFWIIGLRICGWVAFIGALIAGIDLGLKISRWVAGNEKFTVFLRVFLFFAIGGFLLVAVLMVFVEMASDIGRIRRMLESRKN